MNENTPAPDAQSNMGADDVRRNAFRQALLGKRQEAISGRVASGIETEWLEDEEHYQGIDDANRAYVANAMTNAKRWATTGRTQNERDTTRSTVFINITRPYVDAAAARIADMLLPTDDRSWELKPTPLPRMSNQDLIQIASEFGGPEAVEQAIEQLREEAKRACNGMQDQIDDLLTESNWHGECRAMIEDSARIGAGVLKGPYPVKRTGRNYQSVDGLASVLMKVTEIKPGTKRIDPWNFYPDPACGESIHNGSYTWEREYISARQVREMLDVADEAGYNKIELIEALKEGPSIHETRRPADNAQTTEGQFEMWIFHGMCEADDLASAGVSDFEADEYDNKQSAMAVLINDRLVKVTLNVMDTGDFPYDVMAWQRRPGMPWGSGISRQARTAQRMLNGGARALMDNAGLSSAPQIVIGNGITPADGRFEIRGRKLWRANSDVADVRAAFMAFVPPSVQNQLMPIIDFSLKMAEDTTGMPAMLQGQQGNAPDTVGGMQMLQNNASSVIRRLAKRFDDYVTEPHIRRYYDWLMQHSERQDIKGDFQVDVRASSALVERDSQQQFLLQMAGLAKNPEYGIDPAKMFAEMCRGQRFDPKRVQFPPEVIEQRRSQGNPAEEAKAELTQAQTDKARAETRRILNEAVNKSVEALYSATETAKNIATNPAVAPLADGLARSAGFEDQDAAPIVATPPPGVESAPPEENTNPLTPANPAVGMNEGIEGGER